MKKLLSSILVLACVSTAIAQTANDDYFNASQPKFSKDRVSASISAGAGVSFLGSSKNTAYTTFIAPKIGYQLTNKFRLNIGLMHYTMTGNTFMPINRNEGLFNPNKPSISGNMIFVEGQYQLSKRSILSGAVMVDANNFNNRQSNFKAASLGLNYKVSKHSTIGFQATISQGETPYYNGRMGNYNYGSTMPPMQNMFGGFGQGITDGLNSTIR